jgi:hypothetical protein
MVSRRQVLDARDDHGLIRKAVLLRRDVGFLLALYELPGSVQGRLESSPSEFLQIELGDPF